MDEHSTVFKISAPFTDMLLKQFLTGQHFYNMDVRMAVQKCKSLISDVMEFLNLCQDWINVSMCLWIVLKNDNTSVE
jgi:hypothetical protein